VPWLEDVLPIAFKEVRNFLTVQQRSRLHFDLDETATSLAVGEPHLFVLMYKVESNTTTANLRVYRATELVDETQPAVWKVSGTASNGPKFASIRLSLGTRAAAQIDELRVSDSWNAAVNIAK
jgi:hypothetical protein